LAIVLEEAAKGDRETARLRREQPVLFRYLRFLKKFAGWRRLISPPRNYLKEQGRIPITWRWPHGMVWTRLLNLSETVPALFSTFAPFSKVLKVTCIGGKSWMKVA